MPNGQTELASRYQTAIQIQNNDPNQQLGEDPENKGFWQGIGDFVGDWFGGGPSQRRQYLYDMAAMDEQNKWNLEQWERENEYNSTKNQLKRWIEAGGNPNAFFEGGMNTGNASSITSGSPGNITSTAGILGENIRGAIDTEANADRKFWENEKTKAEAEGQKIENGTLKERNELTNKLIENQVKTELQKKRLTKWQADQIERLLPHLECQNEQECEKIKEQITNLQWQTKEIQKKMHLMTWQTRREMQEALSIRWDNFYKKNFSIDPKANWMNNIITASANGNADKILNPMLNFFQKAIEIAGTRIVDGTKNIIFGKPIIHKPYEDMQDDEWEGQK